MQPHLPTPSASSSSLSLSLSLFPSASAVAYLPLRRSRLSLTKPRRDAAERGRARNSSSTPAKHLRPFLHNIYPSSFPLPSSLFPVPSSCSNSWRSSASICRRRLRLRLRLFLYTPRCACAACVRFPFGFSIFRLPLRVLSLFFYLPSTSLNGLPCVGAHSL